MFRAAIRPLMTHPAENPARLAIDDIPAIAMPPSPPAAKTPNPHSSAQAAREFVLGRFSYAYRHPKTFTMSVIGMSWWLARKRTHPAGFRLT
jgi:hypothetical protein